eukprot:1198233-Alexandrium_andersonii.AAC.1
MGMATTHARRRRAANHNGSTSPCHASRFLHEPHQTTHPPHATRAPNPAVWGPNPWGRRASLASRGGPDR